jgi:hypothetical protein
MMVPARRGLIVHISSWAAQKYIGSTLYGVSKAATDKMASDMAHELRSHGVTVVSLYPGLVRTEAVLAAGVFDLSNSESPEFIGRAVAALAGDPDLSRWSGRVLVAAAWRRSMASQTSMAVSHAHSRWPTCNRTAGGNAGSTELEKSPAAEGNPLGVKRAPLGPIADQENEYGIHGECHRVDSDRGTLHHYRGSGGRWIGVPIEVNL